MWIDDVLRDIPSWAWAEVIQALESFETKWCSVIGQVPDKIRPMFVRRRMLQNGLAMVELGVEFGEDVERPDVAWDSQQVAALEVLIAVSLRHEGIILDHTRSYVIGPQWQIMQLPEQMIEVPDNKVIALVARGHQVAAAVLK